MAWLRAWLRAGFGWGPKRFTEPVQFNTPILPPPHVCSSSHYAPFETFETPLFSLLSLPPTFPPSYPYPMPIPLLPCPLPSYQTCPRPSCPCHPFHPRSSPFRRLCALALRFARLEARALREPRRSLHTSTKSYEKKDT